MDNAFVKGSDRVNRKIFDISAKCMSSNFFQRATYFIFENTKMLEIPQHPLFLANNLDFSECRLELEFFKNSANISAHQHAVAKSTFKPTVFVCWV